MDGNLTLDGNLHNHVAGDDSCKETLPTKHLTHGEYHTETGRMDGHWMAPVHCVTNGSKGVLASKVGKADIIQEGGSA